MSLVKKPRVSTLIDNLAPLKAINRWVVWKYLPGGRKTPINVHSKPKRYKAWDKNDPAIWMSYEKSLRLKTGLHVVDGKGYVPRKVDGITFLDFDDVVDPETGKVLKPWVLDLVKDIGSYAEITPSGTGLRVPVLGNLPFKGGHVTLDGNLFEAYDHDQFLTITENALYDNPIIEAQGLLNRLVRYKRTTEKTRGVSDVELPEDLLDTHKKVKRVFTKNDLSPAFIFDGVRYDTLLSDGGKIWKTGEYTPEEFWVFLNEVNETMCLNKDGEAEGLPLEELRKVYEGITKMPLKVSGPEVLSTIETIEQFLLSIKSHTKRPHTTDWDVVWGMVQHGKKYGRIENGLLRVDVAYGTLRKLSRKTTNKTISNSLKRLGEMGVSNGKDKGDKSNHYLIDVERITTPSSWKHAKRNQGNTGGDKSIDKDPIKGPILPQYYSGSLLHVSENRDLIDSITHTSFYRGVGPTKLSYILALVCLGGEATRVQIAEVTQREPNSISRPLKELAEEGVIRKIKHGVYALNLEDLPEEIHRYREQNEEFTRDERVANDVKMRSETYKHYKKSYVFKDYKEREEPRRFKGPFGPSRLLVSGGSPRTEGDNDGI